MGCQHRAGSALQFHGSVHGPDGSPLPEPKILADVNLEEGWHMMTNIVDCPPEHVACGMAVAVTWQRLSTTINLPVFSPVGEANKAR